MTQEQRKEKMLNQAQNEQNLENMNRDNYEVFVPVGRGYHMESIDANGKGDKIEHQLLGFMIRNPTGMDDSGGCLIRPIIEWSGTGEGTFVFKNYLHDSDLPF